MASIAIVEPVSSGVELIRCAREMGLDVYVISHDSGDRELDAATKALVHGLIRVDTNDERATLSAASELAARVDLTAIVPGFEYYVDSVSRINNSLGLPGLSPETGCAVRYKDVMRRHLFERDVRVPRFYPVRSHADLRAAAEHVGFPAVLKPTDASGSIHVVRVNDMAALEEQYKILSTDADAADLDRDFRHSMMLEQYLSGPEYSVEGYITSDGIEIASITEKLLGSEPYFVELGHIVEADLDPQRRHAIEDYVRSVVRALGIRLGVFHCELRVTEDGPTVIEIAARLPGDKITQLIEIAHGISLPKIMIDSYRGRTISAPSERVSPKCFAGIRFLTSTSNGYRQVSGIDAIQEMTGFKHYEIYHDTMERVEVVNDFRGRLGYVIMTGESNDSLKNQFDKIEQTVVFAA